jgi:integrase
VFPGANGGVLRYGNFYRRVFKPAVGGKPAVLRTRGRAARSAVPGALPEELSHFRFHDLRHTAASLAIAAGAHPKVISERLGHSSIAITMDRYGHLYKDQDEDLARRLDETYRKAAPPTETTEESVSVPAASIRTIGLGTADASAGA